MQERTPKPDVAEFICPRCNRNAWAEAGSTILCQPCVNEFLARNVGVMQPVQEEPLNQPGVVPLDPPAGGFNPDPDGTLPPGPDFLPGERK